MMDGTGSMLILDDLWEVAWGCAGPSPRVGARVAGQVLMCMCGGGGGEQPPEVGPLHSHDTLTPCPDMGHVLSPGGGHF